MVEWDVNRNINGETFNEYYLLTDGIYPPWSCFVQSFKQPDTLKKKHFAKVQEAKRKEVERVFGVLQGRFNILSVPGRLWSTTSMKKIVKACVILHNMIIEDQRSEESLDNHSRFVASLRTAASFDLSSQRPHTIEHRPAIPPRSIVQMSRALKESQDRESHNALLISLIEHHWQAQGDDRSE
jgi:hypothetical protein